MNVPAEISFQGMESSEALEELIQESLGKLYGMGADITHSRVAVQLPHQSKTHGQVFHVHISLSVPGGTIVVDHEPAKDSKHEDAYIAVRDAFQVAKRRVRDWQEKHKASRDRESVRLA